MSVGTSTAGISSASVFLHARIAVAVPDFVGKRTTAAVAWIQHRNLYCAAAIPPLYAGAAPSLFGNYTITAQRPRAGGTMQLGIEGHNSFRPTPLTLTVRR